jgi:hypothetical protein
MAAARRAASLAALAVLLCAAPRAATALYEPGGDVLLIDSPADFEKALLSGHGPGLVRQRGLGACERGRIQAAVRGHCSAQRSAHDTPPPIPAPAPQVEFFIPSCPHCVNLVPEFKKVAANLQGIATVAAVDCKSPAAAPLCQQHGVHGFPSLKLLASELTTNPYTGKPMKEVTDYAGARAGAGRGLGGAAGTRASRAAAQAPGPSAAATHATPSAPAAPTTPSGERGARAIASAVTDLLTERHITAVSSEGDLARLAPALGKGGEGEGKGAGSGGSGAGLAAVLLFTDKPKTTVLAKALSTTYAGRLAFGQVQKGAAAAEALGVTEYPTLMVVKVRRRREGGGRVLRGPGAAAAGRGLAPFSGARPGHPDEVLTRARRRRRLPAAAAAAGRLARDLQRAAQGAAAARVPRRLRRRRARGGRRRRRRRQRQGQGGGPP